MAITEVKVQAKVVPLVEYTEEQVVEETLVERLDRIAEGVMMAINKTKPEKMSEKARTKTIDEQVNQHKENCRASMVMHGLRF